MLASPARMWFENSLLIVASGVVSLKLSQTSAIAHGDVLAAVVALLALLTLLAAISYPSYATVALGERQHADHGLMVGVLVVPLVFASQLLHAPALNADLLPALWLSIACSYLAIYNTDRSRAAVKRLIALNSDQVLLAATGAHTKAASAGLSALTAWQSLLAMSWTIVMLVVPPVLVANAVCALATNTLWNNSTAGTVPVVSFPTSLCVLLLFQGLNGAATVRDGVETSSITSGSSGPRLQRAGLSRMLPGSFTRGESIAVGTFLALLITNAVLQALRQLKPFLAHLSLDFPAVSSSALTSTLQSVPSATPVHASEDDVLLVAQSLLSGALIGAWLLTPIMTRIAAVTAFARSAPARAMSSEASSPLNGGSSEDVPSLSAPLTGKSASGTVASASLGANRPVVPTRVLSVPANSNFKRTEGAAKLKLRQLHAALSCSDMMLFYVALVAVVFLLIYPFIWLCIHTEPIFWLLHFVAFPFHAHEFYLCKYMPRLASYFPESIEWLFACRMRWTVCVYWAVMLFFGLGIFLPSPDAAINSNANAAGAMGGDQSAAAAGAKNSKAKNTSVYAHSGLVPFHFVWFWTVPRIVLRKYYHLIAVLMFIPGVLLEPRLVCMAFAGAIAIFIIVECLRYTRIPPFGDAIHTFMQHYLDSRDTGPVVLTHMYLLMGCALPVWLHLREMELYAQQAVKTGAPLDTFHHAILPPLIGVLILGVGDSVASLVGSYFGRHKWPGSKKTLEGTLGGILSVLISGWILAVGHSVFVTRLHCDIMAELRGAISYLPFAISTVLACLLEASTQQIDNLFLPLYHYALLLALQTAV